MLNISFVSMPNIQNTLYRETATHHACNRGPLDLALLLVRFGANIHLEDIWGRTPLDYCDRSKVKISRHIVENAYIREQNWRRRKAFVIVLTAIYGSADSQARQQRLPDDEIEEYKSEPITTNTYEWRRVNKVLRVLKLCRHIASYL
jgi:hypothetical protein